MQLILTQNNLREGCSKLLLDVLCPSIQYNIDVLREIVLLSYIHSFAHFFQVEMDVILEAYIMINP